MQKMTKAEMTRRERPNESGRRSLSKREIRLVKLIALLIGVGLSLVYLADRGRAQRSDKENAFDRQITANSQRMFEEGRQIFRFDTFGDEAFWTDKLKIHQALTGTKLGGVGPGLSPKTALSVGLKVDMDALPADLVEKIKKGEVNLDDPATTLTLIKLNSVVGVKGQFKDNGSLKAIGLSCAVCHSTVDDA